MKLIIGSLLFCLNGLFLFSQERSHDIIQYDQKAILPPEKFCLGVDLSYVNHIEDKNGYYQDHDKKKDPFKIFSYYGANTVRVRLWHSPQWYSKLYNDEKNKIYSNLADVTKTIKRAKKNGMAVCLDIHYSDTWADPGRQNVPEAWRNITNLQTLKDSVYNYTFQIISDLKKLNLLPEMIQVGNETNCGMMITQTDSLFPDLNVCKGHFKEMGEVVNSAIKAIKDVSEDAEVKPEIILHVADPKNLDWWFSNIIEEGKVTDFDIIGFSYYPVWHNTVSFNNLPELVAKLKQKFNKKIMIVETAYPWTAEENDQYNNIFGKDQPLEEFPVSVKGQYDFMVKLVQNIIDAGGSGVMYWEPAWISSDMKDQWGIGSSWENNTFFDFKNNVLSSINYLNYPYIFQEKKAEN